VLLKMCNLITIGPERIGPSIAYVSILGAGINESNILSGRILIPQVQILFETLHVSISVFHNPHMSTESMTSSLGVKYGTQNPPTMRGRNDSPTSTKDILLRRFSETAKNNSTPERLRLTTRYVPPFTNLQYSSPPSPPPRALHRPLPSLGPLQTSPSATATGSQLLPKHSHHTYHPHHSSHHHSSSVPRRSDHTHHSSSSSRYYEPRSGSQSGEFQLELWNRVRDLLQLLI
jgi:hypothetical protein